MADKNTLDKISKNFRKKLYEEIEIINETDEYYRLSKKVIGNEFWSVQKNLSNLYSHVSNGNDLDIDILDSIIKKLVKIKKSAKKFSKGERPTGEYT